MSVVYIQLKCDKFKNILFPYSILVLISFITSQNNE